MSTTKHLLLDPSVKLPPIHSHGDHNQHLILPDPKATKKHPNSTGKENAALFFVGTATTILEWEGIRMMTDPNFLHQGDHVHLGPGVTGTRLTNPAVNIEDLPPIDFVLLSHYHADHFDQKVESMLRKELPIITTPHAQEHLSEPGKDFTNIHAVDVWEKILVDIKKDHAQALPKIRITGMPGKHVAGPVIEAVNQMLGAVPPTNGWILELGYANNSDSENFKVGYTIYISGDTLFVKDLEEIPKKFPHVNLMLIHLGGTTIPGPHMPLLMVTMDAAQGIKLVHLIHPDITIPIHYDDYDVFLSKLGDFKDEVEKAGLKDKVVYLDRGEQYSFEVASV